MKTILIAGLGNPGKEYEKTRHNAGFLFADYFRENHKSDFGFDDWRQCKKLKSEISIGKIKAGARLYLAPDVVAKMQTKGAGYNPAPAQKPAPAQRIILLKPQTFMNLSGEAIAVAKKYYKVMLENIFIVHDEIDLALGKFKVSKDSSSAGHNGAQNVIDLLGTKNFGRLRIGIENRTDKTKIPTEEYVLGKFSREELKVTSEINSDASKDLIKKYLS